MNVRHLLLHVRRGATLVRIVLRDRNVLPAGSAGHIRESCGGQAAPSEPNESPLPPEQPTPEPGDLPFPTPGDAPDPGDEPGDEPGPEEEPEE